MDKTINQSPEQIARDDIDKQLNAAGWVVQDKDKVNWNEMNTIISEMNTAVAAA